MKLLHCSDLHGRREWYTWLGVESVKCDLVCISGDLLDLGCADRPPAAQAAVVEPLLRAIRAPLAICSGNHDSDGLPGWEDAEWLQSLRRKNVWVDGDVFWWQDFRVRCVAYHDPLPHCGEDIWLIHLPPEGVKTSTTHDNRSWGSGEFTEMCASDQGPAIALSGHVHSPMGCCTLAGRTMSLNPGQGIDPLIPNHIVIDFSTGAFHHHYSDDSGLHRKGYTFAAHLQEMLGA